MSELDEYEEKYNVIADANYYTYDGQIIKIEDPDDLIEYCDDSSAEVICDEFNSDDFIVKIKDEPVDSVADDAVDVMNVDGFNEMLPKIKTEIKTEQNEPSVTDYTDITDERIKTEPEFTIDTEIVKAETPIESNNVPENSNVEIEVNSNNSKEMSYIEIPKIKISSKYFKENAENMIKEDQPKPKKSKIEKVENNFSDFFKLLEDLAGSSDNISDVIISKTQDANRPASTSSEQTDEKSESAASKIRWVIKRGPKRKNEVDSPLVSLQAEINQSTYLDRLLESSVEPVSSIGLRKTTGYSSDQSDSNSSGATKPEMKLINTKKAMLRHKCTECPECFTIARDFEIHMELVHQIKPYKCMYCPKEFARSKYLRYHTARHTGENLIKCTECDGEFARKIDYQRHKESHFGIVHKCNECDKAFTRLSNLNMHLKKHMGIKPFVCDLCEKVFYRESGFRKHRENHEAKAKTKEHLCTFCNLQFNSVEEFSKHCAVKHAKVVENK